MKIDYANLAEDELKAMYYACACELDRCKAQKQSKEWKQVIEPLREYIKKYGATINGVYLSYKFTIDKESYEFAMNDDDFDEIFYNNGPGIISVE